MEEETRVENLSYSLSIIPDPRGDRRKEHKRHDVLMIAVLARLCGAESFVDFEDCGKAKEDWLGGFLDLPKGIPSHDTFGRVFAAMDNKLFARSFRNGTDGLRQKISGGIVAIDGKTLWRRGAGQISEGSPDRRFLGTCKLLCHNVAASRSPRLQSYLG